MGESGFVADVVRRVFPPAVLAVQDTGSMLSI